MQSSLRGSGLVVHGARTAGVLTRRPGAGAAPDRGPARTALRHARRRGGAAVVAFKGNGTGSSGAAPVGVPWPRQPELGGAASSSDGGDGGGASAAWEAGRGEREAFLLARVPDKTIVVLRHGSSTWNEQARSWARRGAARAAPRRARARARRPRLAASCAAPMHPRRPAPAHQRPLFRSRPPAQGRIQGNTDESELTAAGREQALLARAALSDIAFDSCFSSPHTRARQTAELVWDRPHYLDSLRECDLGWFQGMRNDDIALEHPEMYRVWREEPERFCLDGRFPVRDAFQQAERAWADMLSHEGRVHLVITHKSILRAMLCTAMGLPPSKFRAIDISNGAVCVLRSSDRGIHLSSLNLTSHLQAPGVRYRLPKNSRNDGLLAHG
ncbi:MAG: histidine phosphatase superfamily [Monoraphidium minutum]|nr:MAG: histidine phosphatase superfamily [Monoraphidium minutum]